MATEMEFIPFKEFVNSLDDSSETPSADAKAIVCDGETDPVAVPANANALESFATESDMTEGNVVEVWTPNGKKKLDLSNVGKNIDITSLNTKTTNISASLAPAFDPTRTSENPYKKNEPVTYTDGKLYVFTSDHYGAWTGSDVVRVDLSASTCFSIVTDNPEYLYAVTDKDGRFLFGIKKDGSIDWVVGIPKPIEEELNKKVNAEIGKSLINSIFADGVIVTDNPEYLYAVTDKDGRFLFGIKKDGSVEWQKGVPSAIVVELAKKVNFEVGKSLINSDFASVQSSVTNPEFLQVLVDFQDKLLSALNHNGQHVFFSKPIFKGGIDWSKDNLTDLGKVLAEKGVMIGLGDWSNSQSLKMPLPNFGIVNINGSGGMPYTKTQDLNVEFEFWDLNGNYFKKPAVINAQGNSSLIFPKRNVAVDLLNADGSSFKLKIGDWVTQDSFHLKSYYTDITRVRALAGYYLFKEIMDAKDPRHDRTWKNALWKNTTYIGIGGGVNADSNLKTQVDDGAVCFPLGFPVVLYYNGEFYGIFCWQLKKHRDNYMMKKSDAKAIHLDGDRLGQDFFRYGTIDWTGFEVRNPKDLVCMDGTAYDGDDPKELIDSTSPYYDGTKKSHKNSKAVKESIIRLSQAYSVISQQPTTDEKKAKIAEYFDVDNLVDYQIFNDFIVNGDAFEKNWQWTTWDGEHWFVNPYDLDGMTGVRFTGNSVSAPPATYGGNQTGKPNWLVITYYQDALNSRYAQLRQSGILSVKNVMDKISKLVLAVGMDNYEKEFEKWPDTPCNNDLKVNTDYWEVEVDEAGDPIMNKEGVTYYNAQLEYNAGDECLYAVEQGVAAKYTMRCTNNSIGNPPVLVFAFRDSYERMINYLTLNEQLKDTLYGYQGGQV